MNLSLRFFIRRSSKDPARVQPPGLLDFIARLAALAPIRKALAVLVVYVRHVQPFHHKAGAVDRHIALRAKELQRDLGAVHEPACFQERLAGLGLDPHQLT